MTLKLDVMLANSVLEAAARARQLEAIGVDGVFTFENAHDVFFPLVAAAPVCSLDLMTNVAMAFPRSPMHLAHMANDLQLLSQGRFRLGLGTQIRPHVEKRYGARWGRPVAHMREWVEAIKAIQRSWQHGERLDFRGEYTTHTLSTPIFNPGPNPYEPPKVLVGALGPRMNEMAASVADGVLVMPFNSADHMQDRTMPAIARGLAASGRARADIEIVAEVIVGVGRTDQELAAARGVKHLVAFYGSTPAYVPVLEAEGFAHLQPELHARSKAGAWAEMADLIPDELLERIAVIGTPDDAAAEIVRRFGECDRVCAYFPYYPLSDDLLADFVAAFRRATAAG